MILLRSVVRRPTDHPAGFPFDVPVIRSLRRIDFARPVTFFVGENGSGKSTLLEAIACTVGSVAVGSAPVDSDRTLDHVRPLAQALTATWNRRTHQGFFLRAEDFFGYARRMATLRAEARDAVDAVDREYEGRSELAKALAKGVHRKTVGEIERRYGNGLDAQSHGESFLRLFQTRLVPQGLYVLDEPEAPLSPLRQLALLSLMKQMLDEDCQFIVATHSPILLAFPDATILSCDGEGIEVVAYDDLEHVNLTRAILNDPERFMRQL